MRTPGATISGLILPSLVNPCDEKETTLPEGSEPYEPVVEAPTVRAFLEVPGGVMPESLVPPISPAENSTI